MMLLRWLVVEAILTLVKLSHVLPASCVNADIINSTVSSSLTLTTIQKQYELHEMLKTEKVLIDALRHFIGIQEHKLDFLKSKTFEIRNVHDGVTDRARHLHNPINALILLKRFTADWKNLQLFAENFLQTEDLTKNYSQNIAALTFPSDEDYDAALLNLLRIQDMYQLEPQQLAVGEINGIKLGSEMSWRDCLEIGRESSKSGFQAYAKYWIETALQKLTINSSNNNNEIDNLATATNQGIKTPSQDDYTVKNKLKIMIALFNTEYKLGNLSQALKIANEMLKIKPKKKNVIEAKNRIENKLKMKNAGEKSQKNNREDIRNHQKPSVKNIKTVEQSLTEEICQKAINLQANKQIHTASTTTTTFRKPSIQPTSSCVLATNNLPFLLMHPLQVEVLSLDPYIVIYHNVLSDSKTEELKDFVVEKQNGRFELTKVGHKKLLAINRKLHYIIGHYGQELYDDWQVEHYNFEHFMELSMTSANYKTDGQAKLLFNLQQPSFGGSVIFPQLDLGINLPQTSMLYWSTLNEFKVHDYRTKLIVCPVISGSQIIATTSIKRI